MERLRLGIVVGHAATQLAGGVLVFWLTPQAVFADIGGDPLAALTLRLGAYSNLAMVSLVAWLLVRRREVGVVRAVALAGVVYNVLAGIDAVGPLVGAVPVRLADPAAGPAIFHGTAALLLLGAAGWPVQSPAQHDHR